MCFQFWNHCCSRKLHDLKISRRLILLFAGSVLLPGLILAYLSFRSVKDENLLIEKSLETRYQSFADALTQILRKTRQSHLENLREQLRPGGSAENPEAAWSLAARLLENPMVQSAVVFRGDTAVFPRSYSTVVDNNMARGKKPRQRETNPLVATIRQEWKAKRYGPCLRSLRILLHGRDSLAYTRTLPSTRFGFQLLELKCLTNLGETNEALTIARHFIRELRETGSLDSYHQIGFYLNETVNLMTSLENLPRNAREEFFTLHQRLPLFLSNADHVTQDWPASPEEILRNQTEPSGDSLEVQYHDGVPYLLVGFPWLTHETKALLRLNENIFIESLRNELIPDRHGVWKDIDFAIVSLRDEGVLSSEGLTERDPALERSFEEEFPAWRLIVYKKPASELMSLGRQRVILQYTLLGFSLLALLLGTLTLFAGVNKEQRTIAMKSNFLSAVSHELKTPLTAIRMFAEMLSSGRQTQEEKRSQYVRRIGEEAERLQGMIEGILNYTRLEENPDALRFSNIDLGTVAEETATLLSGAFDKAGIKLITRLDSPAPLHADYDAMRSLIQNLLENALKYSRPATEVLLEVRILSGEVVLRVADQGIGIPAGDVKRIFERFYRAGDEMTRKTRGSGLGLALVKRIVDAHGGTIKVNSKVNEGTEMIIAFSAERGPHAPDPHR